MKRHQRVRFDCDSRTTACSGRQCCCWVFWPLILRMNHASINRIYATEAWFLANADSEFVVSSPYYLTVRLGDAATARTIVYTTKQQCLPRVRDLSELRKPIAPLGWLGAERPPSGGVAIRSRRKIASHPKFSPLHAIPLRFSR